MQLYQTAMIFETSSAEFVERNLKKGGLWKGIRL
jgi:hypothetical protein